MRVWFRRLGSLKLAVGLLSAILGVLAVGTIIESTRGTDAAGRAVYGATWFRGLLFLFCVNVMASMVERWPWGRRRTGFALTHGALLLIVAGALVTEVFKVEGRLAVWEGEATDAFVTADGSTVRLPFSLRLDAFEIDTYPGTSRPAMFRSRVQVEDAAAGRALPAVIEMNRELAYGGYRLFQTSYQQTPERDQTVLSVARDPGQPIVFAGYFVLLLGMTTVLGTRIAERRALPTVPGPPAASSPLSRRVGSLAVLLGLSAVGGVFAAAESDSTGIEALRTIPVQHDGRVMPLDTVAREAVWNVTGRSRWGGVDPVSTVLGWTFHGDAWATEPIVKIGSAELSAHCGISATDGRGAFLELVQNPCLMGLLQQAQVEEQADRPVRGLLAKARKVEDRLVWMQGFLKGSIYRVQPPPGDLRKEWNAPSRLQSPSDLLASASVAGSPVAREADIDREIAYNRVRPTRVAWIVLVLATALSLVAWLRERRVLDAAALTGLALGFLVMTWGIATRWKIAGRIPAANMYESLLFLGWGVALFALVALVFLRNRLVVLNAAAMSSLTMALTDLLPIDRFVHPVQPVLANTVWLAIHVPIIMLSYSVLTLGVLVAHMAIGVEIFAPSRRDLSHRLSDLLYWYVAVGSILLIAGILTGSMWAASSWGRYWGWDPKEVWSLVAFLAYVAILHGRVDGWLGPFGVAAASIVAFWTILMTYVGVNFILAMGLHSYGFGSSSVANWMALIAAAEAVFLIVGAWACSARRRRVPALAQIP